MVANIWVLLCPLSLDTYKPEMHVLCSDCSTVKDMCQIAQQEQHEEEKSLKTKKADAITRSNIYALPVIILKTTEYCSEG